MRELPKHVYPNGRKFAAVVRHKNVRKYLGSFETPEEAAAQAELFRQHNPKPELYRWTPDEGT